MAEKEYIERESTYNDMLYEMCGTGYQSRALSVINYAPAADVAPVKHGHWNAGYFHDRVCSCCLHPDNDLNDYAHSYCPNCGAKMDRSM